MFKGRYNHSVDAKGRTSLPARFREALAGTHDDRMVLTTALDDEYPHIVAYPYSGWREFEEKLSAKPSFDPSVILLKRLYVSSAVECSVDGHGRILIPPFLKEHAGIGREAAWLGMTGFVELWEPRRWEAAYGSAAARIREIREGLVGLDL